jgi:hypothetical protein
MNVNKTADNKIEIEGDSKLYAMYNEVNGLVIVATAPIKKARVYFNVKSGFDMVDVGK